MTVSAKEIRRTSARIRKNEREQRSPQEQLAILDARGVTAKRERARLVKQIALLEIK